MGWPGFFVKHGTSIATAPPHYRTGVPDYTWVEVLRVDTLDAVSCFVGFLWFWQATGSGIWLNTGRSMRLVGDTHLSRSLWALDYDTCNDQPGEKCRACEKALAQGYDTIQLTQFADAMSFEIVDCRGA